MPAPRPADCPSSHLKREAQGRPQHQSLYVCTVRISRTSPPTWGGRQSCSMLGHPRCIHLVGGANHLCSSKHSCVDSLPCPTAEGVMRKGVQSSNAEHMRSSANAGSTWLPNATRGKLSCTAYTRRRYTRHVTALRQARSDRDL
eukprot:361837-Chlamydomonas_euryale.AAC.1